MKQQRNIHIVGALNLDIVAISDHFIENSSTMARIKSSWGGVGYNIYKELQHKGAFFYTIVGHDAAVRSDFPKDEKIKAVTVSGSEQIYIALMQQGKLLHGAADTSLFEEHLTNSLIDEWAMYWKEGDFLVLEANCPPKALSYLLQKAQEKVMITCFETVSVTKTLRNREILKDLFLLTPTQEEAWALQGTMTLTYFCQKMNIKHCLVTKGSQGVLWVHDGLEETISPQNVLTLKDSTGAGDFFFASLISTLKSYPNFPPSNDILKKMIIETMLATESFLKNRNKSL